MFDCVVCYAAGGGLACLLCVYLVSLVKTPSVDYKGKHVLITGGSQVQYHSLIQL
jgi:hypothetical protein